MDSWGTVTSYFSAIAPPSELALRKLAEWATGHIRSVAPNSAPITSR
jgi:hypothetical protein